MMMRIRTLPVLALAWAACFTALGPPARGGEGKILVNDANTGNGPPAHNPQQARLAELDAYWAEVARCVTQGDFEGYKATCHDQGVLVSGSKQTCEPLTTALARWQRDFTDTRDGKVRASVEFRFSRRLGDATTAHESGIFRYVSQAPGGPVKTEHIQFEGLLVKRDKGWKILMENQQRPATQAEWDALQ